MEVKEVRELTDGEVSKAYKIVAADMKRICEVGINCSGCPLFDICSTCDIEIHEVVNGAWEILFGKGR